MAFIKSACRGALRRGWRPSEWSRRVVEPAAAVWAAQMGTLTFHPWPVRRPDVDHPDELRIDIDPQPGTSFVDARRVALLTRDLLEELGMRGYPKTSGNRGVHVYVRIRPEWTFEEVRHAAIGLGRELERRDDAVTTAWWKEERGARLFIDYNQNNRDRTVAGAWSLRARSGAPVSTPMTWETLAVTEDPGEYNLATVPTYLTEGEPWAGMDDLVDGLWIGTASATLGGTARGRAEFPTRLSEDARGAAAGAAFEEEPRPLGA